MGRTEGEVGRGCQEVSMGMPGTDDSHEELRGSRMSPQRGFRGSPPGPADTFISDS